MATTCRCQQSLVAAFEEVALALGGVVTTYRLPDEAVWDLARVLDLVHDRTCARFGRCEENGAPAAESAEGEEHPAIVHLLRRLHERPAAMAWCTGSCRRNGQ